MSWKPRIRTMMVVIAFFMAMLACDLPTAAATVTPTPGLPPVGVKSSQGGSSGGGGNGGGSGSGGGSGGGNGAGSGSNPAPTVESTSTLEPDLQFGPYVVTQIETLGKESISGIVCSVAQPFTVQAVAPASAWAFVFTPLDAKHGSVSYSYSIPKAGESHQATGTYTLALIDDKVGTLQLSLAVSDHVVFKGFDGNIPVRYKFNLAPVPAGDPSPCKPAP